nr:MAG TPA: hypothetical protein [Caudoviricetes sp.]
MTPPCLDVLRRFGLYWMHRRGKGPRDSSKGSKMDFPVDIAVDEVAAAVKAEGLAYEDGGAGFAIARFSAIHRF